MKLAMIGLGKMGGNMTTRLLRSGIEVVGYDRSVEVVTKLVETEGMIASSSVADAVSKLGDSGEKRIVWLMLPSGEPTEIQIQNLAEILAKATSLLMAATQIIKTVNAVAPGLPNAVSALWMLAHQVASGAWKMVTA